MKHALLAAALLAASPATLLPSPAAAQSQQLEQACITVAKNFLLVPSIKTGIVQSFPELDPPGARLTYSTREDAKPTDFTNQIECEFDKGQPPFRLSSDGRPIAASELKGVDCQGSVTGRGFTT